MKEPEWHYIGTTLTIAMGIGLASPAARVCMEKVQIDAPRATPQSLLAENSQYISEGVISVMVFLILCTYLFVRWKSPQHWLSWVQLGVAAPIVAFGIWWARTM